MTHVAMLLFNTRNYGYRFQEPRGVLDRVQMRLNICGMQIAVVSESLKELLESINRDLTLNLAELDNAAH